MTNKYYWHSRISERKFRYLIRCFVEEKTASETARETNLDRKSVNNIFLRIRRRILESSLQTRPRLLIKELKIKNPYLLAESEKECKEYSTRYESRVLAVLFGDGRIRADIIYAESDDIFNEISNFIYRKTQNIEHLEFYDVIGKLQQVRQWDVRTSKKDPLIGYSGRLFFYLLWRSKKFRGISPEKFILHLRETEWRFNIITSRIKLKQKMEEAVLQNLILKDLYDELLQILRNNPL